MKWVVAIIKPFKFDEIRESINELGISGSTASEVRGFGRQNGHSEIYRGAQYHVDFLPKIKVEVAVKDEMLEPLLKKIQGSAKTGRIGDGKIFVSNIQQSIRIRTGERGNEVL
ncbi:MAG: P-II family nitrogen regulator [Magnetococcales bacterium]|nr:P-II family nitrogen regulator [Magnetococcales bacterium]